MMNCCYPVMLERGYRSMWVWGTKEDYQRRARMCSVWNECV